MFILSPIFISFKKIHLSKYLTLCNGDPDNSNSFDFINNYNYSVKIIANNQNENLRHIEIIKFDAEK